MYFSLKKSYAFFATLFCLLVTVTVLHLCKVSFIAGSTHSFFSLAHAIAPLSGLCGMGGIISFLLAKSFLRTGSFIISNLLLVYHIPTITASTYWLNRTTELIMGIFVPMICLLLFIFHPVGSGAWGYTLYWFIPFGITLCNVRFIFARMLASTFIAHAVGSVLWLYLHPAMTSAQWNALIPVVACERLFFAVTMCVVYTIGYDVYTMCMKKKIQTLMLKSSANIL